MDVRVSWHDPNGTNQECTTWSAINNANFQLTDKTALYNLHLLNLCKTSPNKQTEISHIYNLLFVK